MSLALILYFLNQESSNPTVSAMKSMLMDSYADICPEERLKRVMKLTDAVESDIKKINSSGFKNIK